ncbi:MAG: hypothetical protein Q8R01_04255 [Ramlibacter sp.]|nr:hypothetical protein [Ramlibacter sp.]
MASVTSTETVVKRGERHAPVRGTRRLLKEEPDAFELTFNVLSLGKAGRATVFQHYEGRKS